MPRVCVFKEYLCDHQHEITLQGDHTRVGLDLTGGASVAVRKESYRDAEVRHRTTMLQGEWRMHMTWSYTLRDEPSPVAIAYARRR